jgi:hypothetical protein
MSNLFDNLVKSAAAAAAALVVTWVMSYGLVDATKHVRVDAGVSSMVAAVRN